MSSKMRDSGEFVWETEEEKNQPSELKKILKEKEERRALLEIAEVSPEIAQELQAANEQRLDREKHERVTTLQERKAYLQQLLNKVSALSLDSQVALYDYISKRAWEYLQDMNADELDVHWKARDFKFFMSTWKDAQDTRQKLMYKQIIRTIQSMEKGLIEGAGSEAALRDTARIRMEFEELIEGIELTEKIGKSKY